MKKKVYRNRQTKPDTIEVYYGRDRDGQVDLVFAWGEGAHKGDAATVMDIIQRKQHRGSFETFPNLKECPSLLEELEERGYDLTTLKFSIQKKAP